MQPRPHNLHKRQSDLLTQAANYVFRVHMFVGGLDGDTRETFAAFEQVVGEVAAVRTAAAGQAGK